MVCSTLGVTLGHAGKLQSVHRKVITKMTHLKAVPSVGHAYLTRGEKIVGGWGNCSQVCEGQSCGNWVKLILHGSRCQNWNQSAQLERGMWLIIWQQCKPAFLQK